MPQKTEYVYIPEVGDILTNRTIPTNVVIGVVVALAGALSLLPFMIIYSIIIEIRCMINPELRGKITVEKALERIKNGQPPII